MSGIAGIFNLDGCPADETLLRRMTETIAHRGPDGSGHWLKGPIGLGHRMLHTTPESLLETQPLTDESGAFTITLDGRVDNREELRSALEANGWKLRSETDTELVLRAYQCWGEECPEKIRGDFAFATWDARNQELFCARDIMGIKSFYYQSDSRTFRFASELHQILEDPAVLRQPNEEAVAHYLSGTPIRLEETLFAGIFQLPRAHRMKITASKVCTECYWHVDRIPEISYRNDVEYSHHFLEVFQEAVLCRLRSHRFIAAELSGGLDSSSIVSVAQCALSNGSVDGAGLETFSLSFPGEPYDESPYIQTVIQKWGLNSNFVGEGFPETPAYLEQCCRYKDFPYGPSGEMFNTEMALLQAKGGRVLLTGDGGDQLLNGSPYHNADLLRRLNLSGAIRQSYADSRIFADWGKAVSPHYILLRHGIWPLLPKSIKRLVERTVRGRDGLPPWIAPQFARRIRLLERLAEPKMVGHRFRTIAQREVVLSQLDFPFYSHVDRYGSRFGIEYRHPFLDRKVIEYCLALPHEQLRRGDQTKFVLREAMKGFLPEKVRSRRTKALLGNHTFWNAIQGFGGGRFFDRLAIGALGWVDKIEVQKMYRHTAMLFDQNDERYTKFLWPLWMICGIELWFNSVFEGKIPLYQNPSIELEDQSRKEYTWNTRRKATTPTIN
ncbi:MAG: asparagine synthase (glutamine-hydrolyzing) [Acidobacteria bacterium RIFCSPLOWO2_12_FULL_54_10]|nr:MAG: asparagine synthase (glutamine-hydrolyzing) [Acidobacteria bacterium RIFCSPLOWO2_12_FULL_54_10]